MACLFNVFSCTFSNDDITVTARPEETEEVTPSGYFTYTTFEGSQVLIAKYNELYPDNKIDDIIPATLDEIYAAYAKSGVDAATEIPSYIYDKSKPITEVVAALEQAGIEMKDIEGYYHQPIDEVAFFNLGFDDFYGGTINLINAIGDLDEMKRSPYVGYDKFLADTYEFCGIIDTPGIYSTETYTSGGISVGNMVLTKGYVDAGITEDFTVEELKVDVNPLSQPVPAGRYQLNRFFDVGDIMVAWLDLQEMDSSANTITFTVCHNFYDGRVFRLDYSGTYTYVEELADTDGDGINDDYEFTVSCGNTSVDYPDTDGDGDPDYQDDDDDGDGILTINENADPNEDGNPNDAKDSDGDGTPDYLDSDS